MDNFIWTDESVKQSIRDIILKWEDADVIVGSWDGLDKEFQKWKSEHTKEEPKKYPEGIIAFKTCSGLVKTFEESVYTDYQHYCLVHLDHLPISTIHSVKNKHGEVFTIGDSITLLSPQTGQTGTIQGFEVCGFKGEEFIAVDLQKVDGTQRIKIDGITKVEKQPLYNKSEIISIILKAFGWKEENY